MKRQKNIGNVSFGHLVAMNYSWNDDTRENVSGRVYDAGCV
jgi:hypothetical protein